MPSMIVCPEPLAAKAGLRILEAGGNAVDAAVAASFVQGVVNPQLCGIGGSAELMVYKKGDRPKFVTCGVKTGSRTTVDKFKLITGSRPKKFEGEVNERGYKSCTVPTFVRDVAKAHELYGRLDWAELLQPAIELAENGFRVYPYIERFFNTLDISHLSTNEACARIYLNGGRPYKTGELLVQKDYGHTLRRIAEEGPDVMFTGEIGKLIADDFEKNDGLITKEDLEQSIPKVYDPLSTTYQGYEIYENIPPTSGPFKIIVFNILENFDFGALGWNSAQYIQIVSRAIQLAAQDRRDYLDLDPEHHPEVMEHAKVLTSKEHAKELAKQIVNEPMPLHLNYERLTITPEMLGKFETTYLGVLDSEGNAVSMKHSIGSSAGIVTPGLGFMYNNHLITMSLFDFLPTLRYWLGPRVAPGGMGQDPSMIFKDGKPFLIGGSPAGPWGAVGWIQVALNIIHFGMHPQAAVSVPRFVSDSRDRVITVEHSFPYPYPVEELERLGNIIEVSDYVGRISVIKVEPETGKLSGGTDPRGGGGLAYTDV